MSKSPAVIGAIGFAGCFALSLMMREALRVRRDRFRHPLESTLETRFAGRLAGSVRVAERRGDGGVEVRIELRVLAGLQKARFADEAGRIAWEQWRGRGDHGGPAGVEVVVTDNGEGESMAVVVPRPRSWR